MAFCHIPFVLADPSHLSLFQYTTSLSVENSLQSFYLLRSISCLVRRPQGTPILITMDITASLNDNQTNINCWKQHTSLLQDIERSNWNCVRSFTSAR